MKSIAAPEPRAVDQVAERTADHEPDRQPRSGLAARTAK